MVKFLSARDDVQSPDMFLNLHQNPMSLEEEDDTCEDGMTIGLEHMRREVTEDVLEYYS